MALATNLSEKKRVPKTNVCSPLPIAQCRMSSLIDILVALSILLGYSVTTASFVTYVVREHQNKAKQMQHISGVGVTCYWVTNFIYDMAFYLVPVAFSVGVIAIFKLPAFYSENNLRAVSLLLLLFGYATFSWMYLLAGLFHETGVAFITYVCINLFLGINSIVSLSVVYFLSKEKPNDMSCTGVYFIVGITFRSELTVMIGDEGSPTSAGQLNGKE
ncbi:ATP-binding cassette sub-family A member 12 [Pontoporia blainvillei]|uniref:ATP-binding cassette sub-family A member 12 n=1 Tax=Pontoporia blainvillei TaxID=48723 RepID=A0ABX0S6C2_PONBL|nr:ATP-binding cassette sub-family A member 12 [Pontoporia blainvillei]